MKHISSIFLTFYSIAVVIAGCSSAEPITPKFQQDVYALLKDIRSINGANYASIDWSVTSLDNETKNLLLIHVVQEEIHVLNDSTLFQYGAAVLSLVTGAMENENEYDIWGVEFLEYKNDNNTWKKSFVYKEEDIK